MWDSVQLKPCSLSLFSQVTRQEMYSEGWNHSAEPRPVSLCQENAHMCSGRKMLPCFLFSIPELGDTEKCVLIVSFSSPPCSQKVGFVDVPASVKMGICPVTLLSFIFCLDHLPHPRSGSFPYSLAILYPGMPFSRYKIRNNTLYLNEEVTPSEHSIGNLLLLYHWVGLTEGLLAVCISIFRVALISFVLFQCHMNLSVILGVAKLPLILWGSARKSSFLYMNSLPHRGAITKVSSSFLEQQHLNCLFNAVWHSKNCICMPYKRD